MTGPINSKLLPAIPTNTPRRIPRERGIASLTFGGETLRFRTNPNKIRWSYVPHYREDPTYGGRVLQLLSAKIDDLVVSIDSGRGGRQYYNEVVDFVKDMMIEQKNGKTATFEYTTRGWKLDVYATSIPYANEVENVLHPLELNFKVQEDVSGIMTQNSLSKELKDLQDGVGWKKSKYNQPDVNAGRDGESGWWNIGQLGGELAGAVGDLAEAVTGFDIMNGSGGLPGLNPLLEPFK